MFYGVKLQPALLLEEAKELLIGRNPCQTVDNLTFLDDKEDWPGLKSIAKVISERTDKRSGNTSRETSYYISSLSAKPKVFGQAIRSHWAIENNLHWTLDMVFKEDHSCIYWFIKHKYLQAFSLISGKLADYSY